MQKTFSFLFMLLVHTTFLQADWSEAAKVVASDRGPLSYFGGSVAISGDTAVVGAYQDDLNATGDDYQVNAGAAYVFIRNGDSWQPQAKLVSSDRDEHDSFGSSVAISGDTIVVGAHTEDHNATGGNTLAATGSAYVFVRNGTNWTQEAKLVASDRSPGDYFGFSVDIDGDTVVVGAWDNENYGAAYVFRRSGISWSEEEKLVAADRIGYDRFGSVAISGDTIVVGALYDDHDAMGNNFITDAGSIYVFIRSGLTWIQQAKLVASNRVVDGLLGLHIDISGDTIIAAAPNYNHIDGSVYIFTRNGLIWSEQAKLDHVTVPGNIFYDNFGSSVSIEGNTAVIGAFQDGTDGFVYSGHGAAYIYTRNGNLWSQQTKLTASDAQEGDAFGFAVAISDNNIIVGARSEDHNVMGNDEIDSAGSAYLFNTSSVSGESTINPSIIFYLLH